MNKNHLPPHWSWVKLGEVCERISNGSNAKQFDEKIGLPISRIETIWNEKIDFSRVKYVHENESDFIEKYGLKDNDILFSHINSDAHLGKTAIFKYQNLEPLIHGINLLLLRPIKNVNADFLNYQLKFIRARGMFAAVAQKAVNQSSINQAKLKKFDIALPPLHEQHHIVNKIEALFSELDKGIESLKTAQQQLKVYRQAVLKCAFEGKLTEEWRKKNKKEETKVVQTRAGQQQSLAAESEVEYVRIEGLQPLLPEGWTMKKVGEIAEVVRGGSPRPAGDKKYYDGTIPFLKVADLTRDENIHVSTWEYTIKEEGLKKTRKIFPNILLLTNSGATLGIPKISAIEATINDGIAAFLNLDERSNFYLYYFWLSKTRELRNINQGAAQPNLNTTIIKNVDVPYCSFEEQYQIVSEIESRLSVCDKLETTIEETLQQAEALRQSILKMAFEGRLV